MGGHGDGHGHGHHEPYKIPDYRIYKVEDVPELMQVRNALASHGLKDPWLRNEVWRYNTKEFGTVKSRYINFFFRGFKWGLAATVLTVALTKAWEKINPEEGHGHGHEHH